MTTILIKKKDTAGAPGPGDLTNAAGGAEIAVNTATKRIYTKDSGGTVVELGTYPTEMAVQGNLSATGNTTLGDASTDTVTVNGTTTFNASPVISVTDNSNAALRITQLGTGNALLVEDSSNPDSSPFVIDASGNLIRGYTAALTFPDYAGTQRSSTGIQNIGTSYANTTVVNTAYIAGAAGGSNYLLAKSRSGTIGTNSVVSSGDILGTLSFAGDDGTNFINAAQIKAEVDGTPGTNDMPGRLIFSTTADGASSPTERMRIVSTGAIAIGGGTSAELDFFLRSNSTGSLSKSGFAARQSIQSDVTSTYSGFATVPATQATSFTLTNLRHFDAAQGTFGAGSTVTNQYGFVAASSLTGATNNYGFYGNIASGTGRYNFYAAGTAENYFAGGVTIGRTTVTSPASTDGNVFSGTYTPTQVSTNTNVDTVTFVACQYMRVGNVVTVSGQVSVNPTTASATVVKFSLPIASAFSAARNLGGTAISSSSGAYGTIVAALFADTTNDCVEMRLTPSLTTDVNYSLTFTYLVQ